MWSMTWVRIGVLCSLNCVKIWEIRFRNESVSSSLLAHFFGVMSRRILDRISVMFCWKSGVRSVGAVFDRFCRELEGVGRGRAKQCRVFR